MKISLVTTVLNEEKTIEDFMKSVIRQSRRPDEFIVVDGGSKDQTTEKIKKFTKKHKWIKLFSLSRASVGRGRNYSIEKAKNGIIACIDAGCLLNKKWIEEIRKQFLKKRSTDVVVGIYKPHYNNNFEYFQGLLVVPEAEKIFMNPSRMSSRSIAFKKSIWKKVGGYPDLKRGEDTEFNLKLIKNKAKFSFAKNAVVYWKMRKSWKEFATQFFKYGAGDRKSGNILRMKTNFLMIFGFWVLLAMILYFAFNNLKIFAALVGISFLYFGSKGIEFFIKTKKINALYYGTVLFFLKRICYILGVSLGK